MTHSKVMLDYKHFLVEAKGHTCPANQVWSQWSGKCVPKGNDYQIVNTNLGKKKCGRNQIWSIYRKKCVRIFNGIDYKVTPDAYKCPANQVWSIYRGKCVPILILETGTDYTQGL